MPTITDWLMVVITFVYVVATIFICIANLRSAKATREQLAVSKRQYDEENRAFISFSFIYENRAFYGMRFTNNGKRVAKHIRFNFNEEFIDSLTDDSLKNNIRSLPGRECLLGVGQSYDVFFGGAEFRENSNKLPIEGKILYSDECGSYEEEFFIDFNNYPPIFTVETDAEKIRKEMKKQTAKMEQIKFELHRLNQVEKQEKENA